MIGRGWWVAGAVAWGIGAGWWMPRGPLTNMQALWSVGLSVLVGVTAGRVSRSRWSMVVAPAVFLVGLEVLRLRVGGPSAGAPHASAFGLVVLLAGRGVQAGLTVLPMMLAAAYGAGWARRGRTGGRPSWRYLRRAATGVLTAGLLAVTVAVAVPARTPAIDGPAAIAELGHVDAGGHRLGVLIRGRDRAAPVLLVVPGAPGGSELGSARRHLSRLEQRFVVVTLDRRGGGSSYPALDPRATLTLDGAVSEVDAVSEALRRRFRQDKIYLLAHSGGSILGVLAVQRRPELYRAYIGTGQAVALTEQDRIVYADVLGWARRTGRDGLVRTLTAQGPPPYDEVYAYEPIMLYGPAAYDYDHTGNAEGAGGSFENLDVEEFTLLQKAHTLNAVLDTWDVLYPRMQGVDLRRDVPRLAVPVWFVQGAHEMRGLAVLFAPWYDRLAAPDKHLTVVAIGGHRAVFEQPAVLAGVMEQVLTATAAAPGR